MKIIGVSSVNTRILYVFTLTSDRDSAEDNGLRGIGTLIVMFPNSSWEMIRNFRRLCRIENKQGSPEERVVVGSQKYLLLHELQLRKMNHSQMPDHPESDTTDIYLSSTCILAVISLTKRVPRIRSNFFSFLHFFRTSIM